MGACIIHVGANEFNSGQENQRGQGSKWLKEQICGNQGTRSGSEIFSSQQKETHLLYDSTAMAPNTIYKLMTLKSSLMELDQS